MLTVHSGDRFGQPRIILLGRKLILIIALEHIRYVFLDSVMKIRSVNEYWCYVMNGFDERTRLDRISFNLIGLPEYKNFTFVSEVGTSFRS